MTRGLLLYINVYYCLLLFIIAYYCLLSFLINNFVAGLFTYAFRRLLIIYYVVVLKLN